METRVVSEISIVTFGVPQPCARDRIYHHHAGQTGERSET